MAYKTLIFGVDDLFGQLQPFYAQAVQRGILDVVAFAVIEPNGIRLVTPDGKWGGADNLRDVQLAIISSKNDFYRRMKFLESQGFPRNRIIDGQVFRVPNLDFLRLLAENTAYSALTGKYFGANSYTIYPQVYGNASHTQIIKLGTKSYIEPPCRLIAMGMFNIYVGNFSCIAHDLILNMASSEDHRYKSVSSYSLTHLNWQVPPKLRLPQKPCKILIGNDVWIGRGCTLKCTNPNKPLVIGDGAVVASDSVVVKSVPPYAIVGGNPAKIIKYRFSEDVIEAFQRIKWWDWSLDKIYDNFKYFNDIDKFIALHDKN